MIDLSAFNCRYRIEPYQCISRSAADCVLLLTFSALQVIFASHLKMHDDRLASQVAAALAKISVTLT